MYFQHQLYSLFRSISTEDLLCDRYFWKGRRKRGGLNSSTWIVQKHPRVNGQESTINNIEIFTIKD